jgi:hypothetical protein
MEVAVVSMNVRYRVGATGRGLFRGCLHDLPFGSVLPPKIWGKLGRVLIKRGMSAFGSEGCPLLGLKQTCAGQPGISPFDPKRTSPADIAKSVSVLDL